ncbi:MAG: single-stranded DNA-binding protein [Chloroflexi bacterium]|nr:single-stranded DNA-binding protein [Chloroflexota bacterium]
MSKQYNKTMFIGHLGTDPEMRYTPSGNPVTSFNVANNDQYANDKGEVIKTTTWFRCTAWGKQAEVCNQYLHKGSKVLIEGCLTPDKATGHPRIWLRQDGTATADYELKVSEIHFLDSKNGSEPSVAQIDPVEDGVPY